MFFFNSEDGKSLERLEDKCVLLQKEVGIIMEIKRSLAQNFIIVQLEIWSN